MARTWYWLHNATALIDLYAAGFLKVVFTSRCSTLIRTWGLLHNAIALMDVYAAGFFEAMFTQQVANYGQDLKFAA
jgi:hypothetical protein